MITYIINFVLCSGLLLLVYRAFLAHENLHQFNRFYLLFSLVFSLTVPFITIKTGIVKIPVLETPFAAKAVPQLTIEPIEQDALIQKPNIINEPVKQATITQSIPIVVNNRPIPIIATPRYNYLPIMLITLYGLAVLVLLIRFIRNSFYITRLVAKSMIIMHQDTKLVLINESITPHSFLNHVFINRNDYYDGLIEPEIICHEQAHVRQLHSLDVIFIEMMQIVFWFNPFIPFYRKAIQLNHEFLADEAVIKNHHDTPAYQYLLLAKASQRGSLSLTSQFNYLVTKKRIIMMTKNTSAKIKLSKQLAVVPLLGLLVLLFSHKVQAKHNLLKAKENTPDTLKRSAKSLTEQYGDLLDKYKQTDPNAKMPHLKFSAEDKKRLADLFKRMTPEQQQRQWLKFSPPLKPMPPTHPTQKQLNEWQDAANYGVWINDKRIKNSELAKYKSSDFGNYFISHLTPFAFKNDGFHYQIGLMTKAYYADYRKEQLADTDWFISHRGRIPNNQTIQYAKYGKGVITFMPPANHHDAPQSVINEFKGILKQYDIPSNHTWRAVRQFTTSDKERLEALYKQMSPMQQQQQPIRLVSSSTPPPILHISDRSLNDWRDAAKYGVWVDDKRIKNADLGNYKTSDLNLANCTELRDDIAKINGFAVQVNLVTRSHYQQYVKQVLAANFWVTANEDRGKMYKTYK